jgi:MFS family permease
VLGCFLIAFSTHPAQLAIGIVVFALGAGFSVNARSLATTLVRQEHFASTNTALAISQSAGVMTAGPLLAATWKRGLKLGEDWLGLPFAVAGMLFAAVALVTWGVRLREEEEGVGEAEEGHNDQGDEVRFR